MPLIALGFLACAPVSADPGAAEATPTPEASAPPEPVALVGPELRALALDLAPPLLDDLRLRQWAPALAKLEAIDPDSLTASGRADRAFLVAWCLVHTDRAAEAGPLLPLLEGHTRAPPTYVALVKGEVLLGLGEWLQATEWLARVPQSSVMFPRAALQLGEALRELGRTQEAFALYERLAARPDPADGNAEALLALGRHFGAGSDKAYPYLRRVWTHYPRTQASIEAYELLAAYGSKPAFQPTWQESSVRAERLMGQGDYGGALSTTEPLVAKATDGSTDACRVHFVRGRAHYQLNQLGEAILAFGDIGARCARAEGDYAARALYLKGTAEHRKRRFAASAATYDQLADRFPEHSMADDALTRGGISLQEGGDLPGAQARWRRALEVHPGGDTVPEATWRLAFSLYLQHSPAEAVAVAERLGALPLASDEVHVAAGRYWAARWRAYPDVDAPTRLSEDPVARAEAVARWAQLLEELPHSFYAILAWSRLKELAPDRAAVLAQRAPDHDPGDLGKPWVVRLATYEDPAVRDGVALARLGLIREARDEWSQTDPDALTPDEMAWLTELRITAGDWLLAHDALRDWLVTHPPGTLGGREAEIVRLAYPDRYWDLVRAAAEGDRYEPRLFHALVREESNFNRTIVSHAGARGLSQLMPATARQTAGWLGMDVDLDDLDDPATNLKIGARYLDAMHKQLGDSPYLALAAYNAGAGRVDEWIGAWGNVPTDEYVERIPFRETRGYVKRVMGTWQTMRWQFDTTGPAFPDLSAYNGQARRTTPPDAG